MRVRGFFFFWKVVAHLSLIRRLCGDGSRCASSLEWTEGNLGQAGLWGSWFAFAFACVLYVVLCRGLRGGGGGKRVMGWVNSLQKSNQGKYRAASLFLIARGMGIYSHKYKHRTGTANPPKCKIKKWNDSKATPDYRVRVGLMERTCDRVTQQWALETKQTKWKLSQGPVANLHFVSDVNKSFG